MRYVTFATFFEETSNLDLTNGPNNGTSSHIRDNRIGNPTGSRTGTKNMPSATNTVSQSNINTNTATKNKIDKIAANPQLQEPLDDMDMQELQNTHGINLSTIQDGQPKQINSKIPAAVVRSIGADGKPSFTLMHYKPVQ